MDKFVNFSSSDEELAQAARSLKELCSQSLPSLALVAEKLQEEYLRLHNAGFERHFSQLVLVLELLARLLIAYDKFRSQCMEQPLKERKIHQARLRRMTSVGRKDE